MAKKTTSGSVRKPIYQKIMAGILDRIDRGELAVGDVIPSEHQLLAEFKVSRMTVNRALNELASQGHIHRVQGVGSFVADSRPQSSLLDVQDIARDIQQRGHQHQSQVLQLKRLPANTEIASALELEADTDVFYSQLIHMEQSTPVQLEERYVLPSFAPEYLAQDFTTDTPYRYLTAQGAIDSVEHTLHAQMVENQRKQHLQLSENEPCLVLRRRTWFNQQVVTYGRFFYPGNRYRLYSRYSMSSL